MQYLLLLKIFLLQLLISSNLVAAEINQPYCYKNITETTYKTVLKTRLKNVNSKNFFKKIINKKNTQIEVYEDQEPVYKIKLERFCCEGYKMNEYEQCEPECLEYGCPENSKCVEPEVCECSLDYFSTRSADGKHICQPICMSPCPANSACVGPNICDCKPGYKFVKGNCSPICNLGIECEKDLCTDRDICECYFGYLWNEQTLKCELHDTQTTLKTNFLEYQQTTQTAMPVQTETDNSIDDLDFSKLFKENIEVTSSEITDDYASTVKYPSELNHTCPDDYVFYNGQCQPLKFASSDIDCFLKPCLDTNAVCLENGTCACKEGFILLRNHTKVANSSHFTINTECLTPTDYEAKTHAIKQNTYSASWFSTFLVVLGFLILSVVLVLVGLKLFFRQTGEIDIEAKTLSCAYKKRAIGEAEKSVI